MYVCLTKALLFQLNCNDSKSDLDLPLSPSDVVEGLSPVKLLIVAKNRW